MKLLALLEKLHRGLVLGCRHGLRGGAADDHGEHNVCRCFVQQRDGL